ncbi:MAG: cysteine hydrolase [Deltaproteobacteria bacterium]|nr:cysteine hydrolase [Deltaproteobacteria bacterium]MBW2120282.1 cysteine hydrolase [Deltaproteobacteria bacterium]
MEEKKTVPYRMEIDKTALIVVDMQNDFVREGAPMSLPSCREAIPNAKRVVDACRKAKIPIVYLKFIAGPKQTLIWTWSPKLFPDVKCCWKNHKRYYDDIKKEAEASDIIEEIYPQQGDEIVEKYGYNGFYDSNLENILRAHQVEYTVVIGALTPICVDDTIAGAFERQFKVLAVSDAMGTFEEEFHRNSLKRIEMKYGRVLTTDEFLHELEAAQT